MTEDQVQSLWEDRQLCIVVFDGILEPGDTVHLLSKI